MKGRLQRSEYWWMARAIISLPAPVSPMTRTAGVVASGPAFDHAEKLAHGPRCERRPTMSPSLKPRSGAAQSGEGSALSFGLTPRASPSHRSNILPRPFISSFPMRRKSYLGVALETKGFRKWRRERPRRCGTVLQTENIPPFVGRTTLRPRRALVGTSSRARAPVST